MFQKKNLFRIRKKNKKNLRELNFVLAGDELLTRLDKGGGLPATLIPLLPHLLKGYPF